MTKTRTLPNESEVVKVEMVPSKFALRILHYCNLDMAKYDKICCFASEFIATALLLFLGCFGCLNNDVMSTSSLHRAINFGLVVMMLVQIFGCISGAHMNPTVTVAAFIYDMISLPMAIIYFIAQLLGAIVGYGLLVAFLPATAILAEDKAHGLCITAPDNALTDADCVIFEFVLTSILIGVCCAIWDARNANFLDSLTIRFGLTIICLSSLGGPITGASMNPVRSFAPAVWNNDYKAHWAYWVGPMAAAIFTASVYKYFFRRELPMKSTEESVIPTVNSSKEHASNF